MASHGGPPTRRVSGRALRKEILVFVEGRRTEPQYLVHWHRKHRERILVEIDPFKGTPYSLVERAVERKANEETLARKGKGKAYDQIWCVFDRDEHPNFAEACSLAARKGIQLAISNPCIELWFLLHFRSMTANMTRQSAQRESKALLNCEKVLSASALGALDGNYAVASDRARDLDVKHEGDGSPAGSNPSTGVWRLVDAIRKP
jgi:RloB-like protein